MSFTLVHIYEIISTYAEVTKGRSLMDAPWCLGRLCSRRAARRSRIAARWQRWRSVWTLVTPAEKLWARPPYSHRHRHCHCHRHRHRHCHHRRHCHRHRQSAPPSQSKKTLKPNWRMLTYVNKCAEFESEVRLSSNLQKVHVFLTNMGHIMF